MGIPPRTANGPRACDPGSREATNRSGVFDPPFPGPGAQGLKAPEKGWPGEAFFVLQTPANNFSKDGNVRTLLDTIGSRTVMAMAGPLMDVLMTMIVLIMIHSKPLRKTCTSKSLNKMSSRRRLSKSGLVSEPL